MSNLKIIMLMLIFPLFMFGCSSEQNKSKVESKAEVQSEANPQIKYEKIGQQGSIHHFIFIENGSNISRSEYKKIATNECGGSSVCAVAFWDEKSSTPRSLPMTDAQVNSKIAHYNFNKNTQFERLLICAEEGC